jgi:hypothetical protein
MTPDRQLQSPLHHAAWNQRKWPLNTQKRLSPLRPPRPQMFTVQTMWNAFIPGTVSSSQDLPVHPRVIAGDDIRAKKKGKSQWFQFRNVGGWWGGHSVEILARSYSGTLLLRVPRQLRRLWSMWDVPYQLHLLQWYTSVRPKECVDDTDEGVWCWLAATSVLGQDTQPTTCKVPTPYPFLSDGHHICIIHCQYANGHGLCVFSPQESHNSTHFFLVQSFSSAAIFQLNL